MHRQFNAFHICIRNTFLAMNPELDKILKSETFDDTQAARREDISIIDKSIIKSQVCLSTQMQTTGVKKGQKFAFGANSVFLVCT